MPHRTSTLTIRWLQPVCWLKGHAWVSVMAATAFDWSGRSCTRCEVFQPCRCHNWDWNGNRQTCIIHPKEAA